MSTASISIPTARRERLWELLRSAAANGARFASVRTVDEHLASGQSCFVLKHDVHGLALPALINFAERERAMGAVGTYLFMAPDHPLTRPYYGFEAQVQAMHAVREMGHELGIHVDPYFLVDHLRRPWGNILKDMLSRFRAEGIELSVGNMHGNSKFKMPDRDGYGTMFDLFEELGRQADYPALANVPEETADLIRAHRVRARDFGFTHWADMPLWSSRHGYIVTHFITDNQLNKRGTLEFLVHRDALGQFALKDRHPPGSRSESPARRIVRCPTRGAVTAADVGTRHLAFDSDACMELLAGLGDQPTLFLIHPEHYCES